MELIVLPLAMKFKMRRLYMSILEVRKLYWISKGFMERVLGMMDLFKLVWSSF